MQPSERGDSAEVSTYNTVRHQEDRAAALATAAWAALFAALAVIVMLWSR